MAFRFCTVDLCAQKHYAKGCCKNHYAQKLRAQNPEKREADNARQRERYKENPEPKKASGRRWLEKNVEQKRASDKARYWADPAKRNAESRARYWANPDKHRSDAMERYYQNPARRMETNAAWREANREHARETGRRCRRRRRSRENRVDPEGFLSAAHLRDLPCSCCGAPSPSEVDHILPLVWAEDCEITRKALGEAWCYQPLCKRCNASKGHSGVWCFVATGK